MPKEKSTAVALATDLTSAATTVPFLGTMVDAFYKTLNKRDEDKMKVICKTIFWKDGKFTPENEDAIRNLLSEEGAHFLRNALRTAINSDDDIITIAIAILIGDDDCKSYHNTMHHKKLLLRVLSNMDESDAHSLFYIYDLIESGEIKVLKEYDGQLQYYDLTTKTTVKTSILQETPQWRSYIVNRFKFLGVFSPRIGGDGAFGSSDEAGESFTKNDISDYIFTVLRDAQQALDALNSSERKL